MNVRSDIIQPPMTDEQVEALRQRNAERARVAIEQLGAAWVLYKRPIPQTRITLGDVLRMVRIDRTVNSVTHSRP